MKPLLATKQPTPIPREPTLARHKLNSVTQRTAPNQTRESGRLTARVPAHVSPAQSIGGATCLSGIEGATAAYRITSHHRVGVRYSGFVSSRCQARETPLSPRLPEGIVKRCIPRYRTQLERRHCHSTNPKQIHFQTKPRIMFLPCVITASMG